MMGTTHQMIALLAAFWVLTQFPVSIGLGLGVLAIFCVMVGALTPDLDQPTANLFRRTLGGKLVHRLFTVFSGGHRHFTHSILGIVAIGYLLSLGIQSLLHPSVHSSAYVLWYAFMIGYISHPIADTLTDRGVPWLWPLPWDIKIPPGPEELRVTTDSFVERILVRGGIIVAAVLLGISHWQTLLLFFS